MAVDALIATLALKVDAYLVRLELGIAEQMATVQIARRKLAGDAEPPACGAV